MNPTQQQAYAALFQKYPVAITHLHQQFEEKRLGIVLGAGIGVELGFPDWKQLVTKIALNPKVDGEKLLKNTSGRAITSQMLFQLFKEKYISTKEGYDTYNRYGDIELRKNWKELVHDILYESVSSNPDDWLKASPYLSNLIKVIQETDTMTVTYNFDDTIERLLHKLKTKRGLRGFTVVWDTNVQTEKRPNIVYHPNGYLPRKLSEFASSQLVFLEDSFEDQLVDSFAGHYNALNNHYSSKTCLLLGISLEDRTLKHMLRTNAKKCFGHIHYIIQHVKDHSNDNEANKAFIDAETKANLETYNLYTMHLTSVEIETLMELILLPSNDFSKLCPSILKMRKYFVMGAVAVGKSTTVNQFKCFQTFDEWLEEMPDDMEKAPSVISEESENTIDNWVAEQISLKNYHLDKTMRQLLPCLALIDRTPVDAFAFIDANNTNKENKLWIAKAKLIKSKFNNETPLVGGKIIFLKGDISEMKKRAKQKFRVYDEKDLAKQQDELFLIASRINKRFKGAVEFIDVTNKSIEQVTKEVVEIIYFSNYREANFKSVLNAIELKGKNFYEE